VVADTSSAIIRPSAPAARGAEDVADPAKRRAIRAAMQSVYQRSLGQRFVTSAALGLMLPTSVAPMSLERALNILAGSTTRLLEAVWTIARALGPAAIDYHGDPKVGLHRYPAAVLDVLGERERGYLARFERVRDDYCREAELFAAAIVAVAAKDDCWKRFDDICREYFGRRGDADAGARPSGKLDMALDALLGSDANHGFSVAEYLEAELHRPPKGSKPKPCLGELRRFEREVRIGLTEYLRQFADSVAFADSFRLRHRHGGTLPAASITVQDAGNLMTRVTVTALVTAKRFGVVRDGLDPQSWSACSDVFLATEYVEGPYDLRPVQVALGDPGPAPRLLLEDVVFLWGDEGQALGASTNVLSMDRLDFSDPTSGGDDDADVAAMLDRRTIDVEFSLSRSIESRLLWDVRAGGVIVDDGDMRVRSVDVDLWRVTSHKTLLYADRQPYATGAGATFGQTLNILAPATLCWWMESEMFSTGCKTNTQRGHR
jgi:hypothetical protein